MHHIPPIVANEARKFSFEWIRKHLLPNKELQREVETLKARVAQLTDEKAAVEDLMSQMGYSKEDDGVYFKNDGSGPYCPTCLHADRRDILLTQGATAGVYGCPIHGTTYWMRSYREGRSNRVPVRRYRAWSQLRRHLEAESRRRATF
jgi:hypothetical protein